MAFIDTAFALNPAFRLKMISAVAVILNPIWITVMAPKMGDDQRNEFDTTTIDLFWANELIRN